MRTWVAARNTCPLNRVHHSMMLRFKRPSLAVCRFRSNGLNGTFPKEDASGTFQAFPLYHRKPHGASSQNIPCVGKPPHDYRSIPANATAIPILPGDIGQPLDNSHAICGLALEKRFVGLCAAQVQSVHSECRLGCHSSILLAPRLELSGSNPELH